ncbi:WLM domain-containing protein [Sparassis latifolia]
MPESAHQEDARQLLRALAAQLRPVMKGHGFVVNSLEEYEHNIVFAGRNWNNGEVVELVLRGASGAFLPVSWLMSTLCHELAHIQHMNHGSAFQALWTKLRNEVRALQSKGYYGDGYWSSGTRLADSSRVGGQSLDASDMPEYMCGGAQKRTRPTSLRRRRGAGAKTGAQTAKKRKAGTRVTARDAFKGSGRALNEDVEDEKGKKAGAGFRKKAGSKRARQERALAAERRLQALQTQASSSGQAPSQNDSDAGSDGESDDVEINETDQDRRRAMDEMEQGELEGLRLVQTDFSADFVFPSSKVDANDESDGFSCDVQSLPRSGTAATTGATKATTSKSASPKGKNKARATSPSQRELEDWLLPESQPADTARSKKKQKVSYGAMVQDEVVFRKKEVIGLVPAPPRRLGGGASSVQPGTRASALGERGPDGRAVRREGETEWSCQVCTLSNAPGHLACSACATPRGESTWGDA